MSFPAIKKNGYSGPAFMILIGIFFFLTFAPSLYGATYYIDATNGRDTNNRKSEATAWKT
jgi:hypothetical protein